MKCKKCDYFNQNELKCNEDSKILFIKNKYICNLFYNSKNQTLFVFNIKKFMFFIPIITFFISGISNNWNIFGITILFSIIVLVYYSKYRFISFFITFTILLFYSESFYKKFNYINNFHIYFFIYICIGIGMIIFTFLYMFYKIDIIDENQNVKFKIWLKEKIIRVYNIIIN
jgi:hypothetical protein